MARTLAEITANINALHALYAETAAKAKNSSTKAEQIELKIGREVILAKQEHKKSRSKSKVTWKDYVRMHFPFGSRRADELIQIAGGDTTADKVREGKRKSVAKSAKKKRALASAQNSHNACDDIPIPDDGDMPPAVDSLYPGDRASQVIHWLVLDHEENAAEALKAAPHVKNVRKVLIKVVRDVASAWSAVADALEQRKTMLGGKNGRQATKEATVSNGSLLS